MVRNDATRRRLERIDDRLVRVYGAPRHASSRKEPLDALIATVLSQHTNNRNSHRAYAGLRKAFPTWDAVMRAPRNRLEQVLRPAGLARTRSMRIQQLLRSIADHGPLTLKGLRRLSNDEAERRLLAFDGVGLKTARCVLLFALDRGVFPVDTHILRILKRLGVLPLNTSAGKAHERLAEMVPPGRCLSLHVNLIAHGCSVCHPRNPACPACVLRRDCDYFRSPGRSPTAASRPGSRRGSASAC